jgi:LPS sulfotransferase NodH
MSNSQQHTRFVILNSPRVGSNMLCTLLDAHPEILCHHELFNPHLIGYARSLNDTDFTLGTLEERVINPHAILERAWQQNLNFSCVGFKMCWKQHQEMLTTVLEDTSVKKVILKRRNQLKSFVSLLLARKTTNWVVYNDEKTKLNPEKVHVDLQEFREFLDLNRAFYGDIDQALLQSGQVGLELYFEDLFDTDERARMLRFLDVSALGADKLQENTTRINPQQLEDLVVNYDEVQQMLHADATLQQETFQTNHS